MFWKRRAVLKNEQNRLLNELEKSRGKWKMVQHWRMSEEDAISAQIPKMLSEVRFRYLLAQARKRNWINEWFLEDK